MSLSNEELRWIENARTFFEESLEQDEWIQARNIIEDMKGAGFSEEAATCEKELKAAQLVDSE